MKQRTTRDPWFALKDGLVLFRGPVRPPLAPKEPPPKRPRIGREILNVMNAARARDEILGLLEYS